MHFKPNQINMKKQQRIRLLKQLNEQYIERRGAKE